MKVGIEWLRDWVEIEETADELAARLTTAGLEVDSVSAARPGALAGVRVARVASVRRHPEAKRLSVCEIDDGRDTHVVVCGASNVAPDIKVAFAPPGATLADGREISVVELKGVTSAGMLCSAAELGLAESSSGILHLDREAPPGTDLEAYLGLDDHVLDIDLTANRGDCFSVRGIAREVAASAERPLRSLEIAPVEPSIGDSVAVKLRAPEACPRFAGRVIRGIQRDAVTPLRITERLRRAGLRPIHPVVDVTNYVMLELGQPLHGYDLGKLEGPIEARFGRDAERIELLDGSEVELDPSVLVIADRRHALGIAGVMGGASSAIDVSTEDVFLEAAFFAPAAIAGRPRRYGLQTDASQRFERGVDPEGQVRAIEYATRLLLDIAGGSAGPLVVEESREHFPQRGTIELRRARLAQVLGTSVEPDRVTALLESLEIHNRTSADGWLATPPSFRFDLAIEEDLIEEVGRMVGYDTIPVTPGAGAAHLGFAPEGHVDEDQLADLLVGRGYYEVVNYSFVDEALETLINPGETPVRLENPISQELNVLRRSLWPGLLVCAQRNLARQQARLRLFEIGQQFALGKTGVVEAGVLAGLAIGSRWPEQWDAEAVEVDYFDVRADIEALIAMTGRSEELRFVPGEHPALRPGQTARILLGETAVGWLGVSHPQVERHLDLRQSAVLFALRISEAFVARRPRFESYPKFPSIRRDLAVVVDEDVSARNLVDAVHKAGGPLLKQVVVFDLYRGKGIDSRRKSVALGLILQGTSRTLTDVDADQAVRSVTRHLERELGATIRTQ